MMASEPIWVDRGPRLWEVAIMAILTTFIVALAVPVGIWIRPKLRWSMLYVALIFAHVLYTGVGYALLALIGLALYWAYEWYLWSDRTATAEDRELLTQVSLPTPNHFGL